MSTIRTRLHRHLDQGVVHNPAGQPVPVFYLPPERRRNWENKCRRCIPVAQEVAHRRFRDDNAARHSVDHYGIRQPLSRRREPQLNLRENSKAQY